MKPSQWFVFLTFSVAIVFFLSLPLISPPKRKKRPEWSRDIPDSELEGIFLPDTGRDDFDIRLEIAIDRLRGLAKERDGRMSEGMRARAVELANEGVLVAQHLGMVLGWKEVDRAERLSWGVAEYDPDEDLDDGGMLEPPLADEFRFMANPFDEKSFPRQIQKAHRMLWACQVRLANLRKEVEKE